MNGDTGDVACDQYHRFQVQRTEPQPSLCCPWPLLCPSVPRPPCLPLQCLLPNFFHLGLPLRMPRHYEGEAYCYRITTTDMMVSTVSVGPWQEDIDLMGAVGWRAYRFSISWSRVLPGGSRFLPPSDWDRCLEAERLPAPCSDLYGTASDGQPSTTRHCQRNSSLSGSAPWHLACCMSQNA